MRVLLLNPPYKANFIRCARSTWPSISGSNWYPIFLAYATGWLEKHKIEAKLIDALVMPLTKEQVYKISQQFKPQLLVLYVSDKSLKNDLSIGKQIKKLAGCQLILVGPWCSFNPEGILRLNPSIDGIVRREFEDVILDIAQGKSKEDIRGLVFRKGKKIISNPERAFLTPKQLDQFPYVTDVYKRHLNIGKYHQASLLHPYVDLFTARGCPWGKCTFCLWPNTIHKGSLYRARSLKNVIAEFKYVKKELPKVKEIFIQDDTLPAGRARQLAKLILKNKIKITWSCYARAEMDLETLKLMKSAGCRYLHVGFESADQKILQNICKGTTLDKMKVFAQNAKKSGLKIHGDFIVGLPGETEETIKKTIQWAKNLGIEGYQFLTLQPQKETPLYGWLKKRKYLLRNEAVSYPNLQKEKLEFWRLKAMREIYLKPKYIINTVKNIKSASDLYRLTRTALHVIPNILKKR